VAAANLLVAPLRAGQVPLADLERVQRRRMWPALVTQALQLAVQRRIIRPVLDATEQPRPPLLRLLSAVPPLRRLPARLIGIGVRPEHVRAGESTPGSTPS
jgi:hypothetical protein